MWKWLENYIHFIINKKNVLTPKQIALVFKEVRDFLLKRNIFRRKLIPDLEYLSNLKLLRGFRLPQLRNIFLTSGRNLDLFGLLWTPDAPRAWNFGSRSFTQTKNNRKEPELPESPNQPKLSVSIRIA